MFADLDVSALTLTRLLPVHQVLPGLTRRPQARVTATHAARVLLHLDTGALLEHVTIIIIIMLVTDHPHLVTPPRPQPTLAQHYRD